MAANKIGIVLALDGEREFTNGMKNAQQSAKLCGQQLKNIDKEYKGNANSLEALSKKQEALVRQQDAYNRELDSAKNGQKNAVKNYQEATKHLDELEKELEEAKKAMEDMEKSGDTSSNAYKKQAKAVEDLEKKVSKQANEQAKASTNITKWDTAVARAEGNVRECNKEVDRNAKYVAEAANSADKCASSIDKMGEEVTETKNELSEASEETKGFGDGLKGALQVAAGNLISSGISNITDAAKEAAEYVVEVGSAFESSMSKVEALSGASQEELDRMSDAAKRLGSNTKFSAKEVADGFSYMALAGWDTQEMLSAIDGIVNLAAASEMDLAEASDMVTDYLSAFGLSAADAGKMADQMAYAQANSNTTTTQLGEAFGNSAANMHAAGQSMESTTAILEAFANQGLKGSEAGTKLAAIMRDITAKMKDGKIQIGDTAVEVMDAEGNFRDLTDILADVEDATEGMGDAEKASALAATFTSRSVSGLNMILNEGVDNVKSYKDELNNCDGAAEKTASTMQNNLQGAVTTLNSATEGLGIALYEKVSGPLTTAVNIATGLISGITAAIDPPKTEMEQFLEDIEAANDQVKDSIESAKQTAENGRVEVAKLEGYQQTLKEILDGCSNFNAITLEDGRTAIVNAAGEVVAEFADVSNGVEGANGALEGFGADGLPNGGLIITDAEAAQGMIGYIGTVAKETEGTLSTFCPDGINTDALDSAVTASMMLFDGDDVSLKKSIGNVEGTINEFGNVTFDTSGVTDGTQAIITAFDDTGKEVAHFRTTVSGAGNVTIKKTGVTTGTNAIVKIFNEAGEEVENFKTTVSDSGTVDIPTDNIESGASAIVTALNSHNEEIEVFRGSLENIGSEIDVTGAVVSMEGLAQSMEQVYVVTDDFKKYQINNILDALGDSATDLKDKWDPLTGTLRMSNEEIERWFGNAMNVAMQNSLQSSLDELYTAKAEAIMAQAKSQSAMNESYAELGQVLGVSTKEAKKFAEALIKGEELTYDQSEAMRIYGQVLEDTSNGSEEAAKKQEEIRDALENCTEANEQYEESAKNVTAANDEIKNTTEALKPLLKAYIGNEKDVAEEGQKAAEATEGMAESVDNATEAVYRFSDGARKAYDAAAEAIEDAYDRAVEAAKSAFSIDAFADNWGAAAENGMDKMKASFDTQIEGMTKYSENFAIVSDELRGEYPKFLEYLQNLGESGSQVVADLADAFRDTENGPERAQALIDRYTDYLDASGDISKIWAQNTIAMKMGAKEFGSSPREWANLDSVVDTIKSSGAEISAAVVEAYDDAREQAENLGVAIPDGLAEAIASSEEPEDAIREATEKLNAAMYGTRDQLIQICKDSGIAIPESIQEGIASGTTGVTDQITELTTLLANTKTELQTAAEDAGAGVSEGIEANAESAKAASETVTNAAKEGAQGNKSEFKSAGSASTEEYASGVRSGTHTARSAGRAVEEAAVQPLKDGERDFYTAGTNSGNYYASGILTANASSAGSTIGSQARAGAAQWEGSFYSIGVNMAAGLRNGILSQASSIAQAAANTVNQALIAARKAGAIASPSKKFRDMVGKEIGRGVAWGIKDTANLSAEQAEALVGQTIAAMQKKLSSMKASGEEIAYAWNETASNFIQKKFNMSWYDKSGAKKDAETYYSDIYKTAKVFMDNLTTLYNVSDYEQKQYWQKVKAGLKRGTQAWYDAQAMVNYYQDKVTTAYKKQKDEEQKAREEAAEKAKQTEIEKYEQIVSSADAYLDYIRQKENVSIKQELAFWQAIKSTLKGGTDAYIEADRKILALMESIGTISSAENILSTYQTYYEMSERAEMEYWDRVRQQYRAGTEARIKADQKYVDAKTKLNDKLKDLEDDYHSKVDEINKTLSEGIERLNDQYTDAVKARADAIAGAFDIFEAFESKSANGDELLFNIRAQAEGYEFWEEQIDALTGRQRLSDELLQELIEKGPKEVAALVALNSLSDEQLDQYQAAYDKKMDISMRQATEENEALRKDIDRQIDDLKLSTAEELNKVVSAYRDSVESVNRTIDTGLATLADKIRDIAEDEAMTLAAALTGSDKATVEGLSGGTGSSVSTATISNASGTGGVAHNGQSAHDAAAEILSTGIKRSKTLKPEEAGYSPLFKHIVQNYGVQPGQQMYKLLAGVLGVDVDDTVTAAKMNEILKALQKNGLRYGTRYLSDAFAWMDELGLGSELIVRKSDNAILNTAVQKGDAIIPANLTNNLYKWGAVSPDQLMTDLANQQRALQAYVAEMAHMVSMTALNDRLETGYQALSDKEYSKVDDRLEQMLDLMSQFLPYMAERQIIEVDGREIASATAEYTGNELAMRNRRRRA